MQTSRWTVFFFLAAVAAGTIAVDSSPGNNNAESTSDEVASSRIRRMTVCRPGWRKYQGSCYCRVSMSATVTWHEAQKACNNHGGHLPTISSAAENSFVYNLYKAYCRTSVGLLGFHDYVREGNFIWVDDSSSCYTNWNSGEPNNNGGHYKEEDCALMFLGGKVPTKWNDFFCHEKHTSCFLCENTPSCPVGWTPFGGKCFRHVKHKSLISWKDARSKCRLFGADLVSINCVEDEKFLNSFMAGVGWYFIGYTDAASEGKFHWTDGSTSTYTHWGPKEPNNAGSGEDCAAAHVGINWNDIQCATPARREFVCEM